MHVLKSMFEAFEEKFEQIHKAAQIGTNWSVTRVKSVGNFEAQMEHILEYRLERVLKTQVGAPT